MKYFIPLAILVVILIVGFLFFKDSINSQLPVSVLPINSPLSQEEDNNPQQETTDMEIIATNLEVPWALAFLPNKDILVTERLGKIKLINSAGEIKDVGRVNVKQVSESGLHGIAIDPSFDKNHYIYLYYTYSSSGDNTLNKVSRFTFDGNSIKDEKVIVDQIPGAQIHDGGRLKFGPDLALYITTGDAANPSLSQDKNSLAGKILRIKDEKVEMVSYGHRNPQGITWDNQGRIWEVEHGQSATDELNLIVEGQNYGWPTIRGDQTQTGMKNPEIHSGSNTWAPGGIVFFEGSVFFAGLRGQGLFQYNIESKNFNEHFKNQFGRIRDVVLGPDNMLYITTSNRDGRGSPSSDDDRIIKVNPQKLSN